MPKKVQDQIIDLVEDNMDPTTPLKAWSGN